MTKSKCGTNSGYSAHRYYKNLPPCDPCKTARREYMNQWHKEHPGYRKNKWDQFKIANPDYKKDYHKDKPEQTRQDARRRRARIRGVESQPYTESEVLDLYGFSCHLCGDLIDLDAPRTQGTDRWEKGLHLDHLVPISAGGSNTISNVRPAHGLCNLQKGIRWQNIQEEN
jgi:5-methylcytosine-specific restriction endonuclease McrA